MPQQFVSTIKDKIKTMFSGLLFGSEIKYSVEETSSPDKVSVRLEIGMQFYIEDNDEADELLFENIVAALTGIEALSRRTQEGLCMRKSKGKKNLAYQRSKNEMV